MTCARRSLESRNAASRLSSLLASSCANTSARDFQKKLLFPQLQQVASAGYEFLMVNGALKEIGGTRFKRAHTEAALFVDSDNNDGNF